MQFILACLLVVGFLASTGLMPGQTPACPVDAPPYLAAEDDRPLGGRIPLILVHGWIAECHGGKQGWERLIARIEREEGSAPFKIYRFIYSSRRLGLEGAGSALAEAVAARGELQGEGLLLIGHSVGGLVARTFMELDGGGERTIKLITLATPHHGSPLASLLALVDGQWSSSAAQEDLKRILNLGRYSDPLLRGAKLLVSLSYRLIYGIDPAGFLDLRWDDYDDLTQQDYAGYSERIKEALDNRFLQRLNSSTRFDHKIIAYYGYLGHRAFDLRRGGELPFIFYGWSGELERRLPGNFDWNDGLIPIQSASFAGHRITRRGPFPSMTHTDIRDHPQVQSRLLEDLEAIAAETEAKNGSDFPKVAAKICGCEPAPLEWRLKLCADLK